MDIGRTSLVAIGEGFTPQNFGSRHLAAMFPGEPTSTVVSPVFTQLQYDGGYEILVLGDRLEIKLTAPEQQSAEGSLAECFKACLLLWPLVEIRALGINFLLIEPYSEVVTPNSVRERFLNLEAIEGPILGHEISSRHVFTFPVDDMVVNATVADAEIPHGMAISVDFNLHFEPPGDVAARINNRPALFERCNDWGERLVGIRDL